MSAGGNSECVSEVSTERMELPDVTMEYVRDSVEELRVDEVFKLVFGARLVGARGNGARDGGFSR